MSYNAVDEYYETKVWMRNGNQFKFKVGEKNYVSPYYQTVYVLLFLKNYY